MSHNRGCVPQRPAKKTAGRTIGVAWRAAERALGLGPIKAIELEGEAEMRIEIERPRRRRAGASFVAEVRSRADQQAHRNAERILRAYKRGRRG